MDKKVTVSFSIRSLLGIALALIVLAFAYSVRSILILFVVAYILASAMRPFVLKLKKYKIPKPVSIIGIYLILLFIIFFIFRVLVPPVAAEVDNLVANRQEIASQINEYFANLPSGVGENIANYAEVLPGKIQGFFFSGRTFENILGLFAGFGGILTVLFVAFYMLLEESSFERFIKKYW